LGDSQTLWGYSRIVINSQALVIAYFAVLLDGPESGATKKVREQVRIWKELGVKVTLYVISNSNFLDFWEELGDVKIIEEKKGIKKLLVRYQTVMSIMKTNANLIYIRDSFPFFLPASKRAKLVVEIQSNLQNEVFRRGLWKGFLSLALDFVYLKKFSGYISVSNELLHTPRLSKYSSETNSKVIANGINLNLYKVLPLPTNDSRIGIFFIGQKNQPWHGLNQIYDLAGHMTDFDFHIIGSDSPVGLDLQNVYHYGVLPEKDYLSVAARCSIGIGSLNLRSLNMNEASPLKTRNYLALGLPVVARYADTDFRLTCPFILNLPVNEEPASKYTQQIVDFAQKWSQRRVQHVEIQVLDLMGKEQKRIEYLLALVQ